MIVPCTAQYKTNLVVQKAAPMLYLNGTSGLLRFYGPIDITQSAGLLTLSGANLSLGTNSLLGTGSIGLTGSRFLKAFVTDIESTNTPTVGGISLSDIYVPTSRTINSKSLTSNISITSIDIGLGNVNNTSDVNKPISTATQTALNLKANLINPSFTTGITTPQITLGSTLLTPTGTELNKLAGGTFTKDELNKLVGLNSGTIQQQIDNIYNNSIFKIGRAHV